jgi:hypothetical protein
MRSSPSELPEDLELERASLSLAAARWVLDHPDRKAGAGGWVHTDHARLDLPGIERAAEALAEQAEEARRSAEPGSGPSLVAIDANLRSARSGFFGTAVGPLADFLRDQGEEVTELLIW